MKYVALLRGVNVGGRVVKMDALKTVFESLGYSDVSTVLQSGNVVFASDKSEGDLTRELEAALTESFDYPAKVQVRSIPSVLAAIETYPFDFADETYQHYVIFFVNGLEQELARDASDLDTSVEQIEAGDGVLYWRVPKGMTLKSEFAKFLTKAKYREFHTNRNLNTLQKIIHASI